MPNILRLIKPSIFLLILGFFLFLAIFLFPIKTEADYQADFVDLLNMGIPSEIAQQVLEIDAACGCVNVGYGADGQVTISGDYTPSALGGQYQDFIGSLNELNALIGQLNQGSNEMHSITESGKDVSFGWHLVGTPEQGGYEVNYNVDPDLLSQVVTQSGGSGRIDGRTFADKNGNGVFDREGDTYQYDCVSLEYGDYCQTHTVTAAEADFYLDGATIMLKGYTGVAQSSGVFVTATATTTTIAPPIIPTPTPNPTPQGSSGFNNLFDYRSLPFLSLLNPKSVFAQDYGNSNSVGGTAAGWRWNGPGWYVFPGLPLNLINPVSYTVSVVGSPHGYKPSTTGTKTVLLGSCVVAGGCPPLTRVQIGTQTVYQYASGPYPYVRFNDYLLTSQVDFGLVPITPLTVQGYAFNDLNGDKVKNANEPGIEGVNIKVGEMVPYLPCYNPYGYNSCANFNELQATKTDSSGKYVLDNVPANTPIKFDNTPPNSDFTTRSIAYNLGQQPLAGNVLNADTTIDFPFSGPLPTPTPTSSSACGVSGGSVYVDTGLNNCASGTSLYTGTSTFSLNDTSTGTQTGTSNYASTPATYSTNDNSCSGTRALTLSSVPSSYRVESVKMGVGQPFNASSGFTSPSFTYSSSSDQKNISWCLTQGGPWFQTDKGDVRLPNLVNLIPSNNSASTNSTFPGLFISSSSDPIFGGFTPSVKNWQVKREYLYNKDFVNGLGGMSYDFYKSQAKKKQISIGSLPSGSINLTSLTSGIYEVNGNATIPASTITGGKNVILLVNGTATITGAVSVPQGNLFILAAKNNINIQSTIGVAPSSPTTSLEGIYTAQGSINLQSSANCSASTSDLRLNIGGALIANSLHPFATGGSGVIANSRNLCGSNALYPSYSVFSRPDFILKMTDFYKTTYKTFREVEP